MSATGPATMRADGAGRTAKAAGDVGPRLLSVVDAAAYLGLTGWQIRGLVWAGTLPGVRVGRRLYLDRRDLDALPDRLKVRHPANVTRLRRSRA